MERPVTEILTFATPDLLNERQSWLAAIAGERRLADNTVEAYERDTRQFLTFLTGYIGKSASIADIADLRPVDLRAFLASRRREGAGARSLGRHLAGLRSFLHYLQKKGLVNAAGATAMRSPKQPKSLPKPLTDRQALKITTTEAQLNEEPWIAARNAAVLSLLYGCGLRISEALGLAPADFTPDARSLRITGKGNKTRMVPVLPQVLALVATYVAICPYDLPPDRPLFVGTMFSRSRPIDREDEQTRKEMRQLNNSWFRLTSRFLCCSRGDVRSTSQHEAPRIAGLPHLWERPGSVMNERSRLCCWTGR